MNAKTGIDKWLFFNTWGANGVVVIAVVRQAEDGAPSLQDGLYVAVGGRRGGMCSSREL